MTDARPPLAVTAPAPPATAVLPTISPPPQEGAVLLRQQWVSTVFLHWQVDAAAAARRLPPGVEVDTIDGRTYVGVVLTGFAWTRAAGVRVPYLGTFLQANVRLYTVDAQDRHGVHFLSLDAARLLPAVGARLVARLPYAWASVDRRTVDGSDAWTVRRRWRGRARADVRVRPGRLTQPDPTQTWLIARWGLHGTVAGRSFWAPVRHEPWTVREAEVDHFDADLVSIAGLEVVPGTATRPLLTGPVTATVGAPSFLPR